MRPDQRKLDAYAGVQRRFPQHELPIRRLMETSEDFADMCEELLDAERALRAAANAPDATQAARHAEWQDLVDRLVAEIERSIRPGAPSRADPAIQMPSRT